MTAPYSASINHPGGYSISSWHDTLAAAQAAVLAAVPAGPSRYQFSATANEWATGGKRLARYWQLDTMTRTFLPPRDPFASAGDQAPAEATP